MEAVPSRILSDRLGDCDAQDDNGSVESAGFRGVVKVWKGERG